MQIEQPAAQIAQLRARCLVHRGVRRWSRRPQARPLCAARSGVEIERLGDHLSEPSAAVASPAWTIPIELDAIPVGIAEIQGFAHAVVAGAVEWNACLIEPAERRRRAPRDPDS